ncbi:MAG: suppressor of fused domain protein, partial [Lachnospiraceae bacterium]|nr:suppressor of fused domain protein [Lachnospiraceae bacterium]
MNIFKKTKKEKNKNYPLYCYDDGEIDEIEKCIEEKFGAFKEVFHEIFSPDIHLDVCFVEPTESEPYYKLVTMGAGAYKMKVPKNLEQYDLECAEYVIYIPKEWNFKSDNINDYWPTKALKDVARLPVMCDTW